ncbi:MAG: hypothetical protein RB292_04015 [Patescibacteria group bacterium]|jgi:3D (Asp-Asp-Asp) domain-containing protein|nr:hypothetical protein [Patescibacteria group bacterium]
MIFKSNNKLLVLMSMVLLVGFWFDPAAGLAQGQNASTTPGDPTAGLLPEVVIKLGDYQVPLSSINCAAGDECEIPWIGEYISALYRYGVGLAVTLAVVMIMAGGFLWLMSGGSPDRVGKAKEFIISAFSGVLLALFSFIILQGINPELVKLNPIKVYFPDAVTIQAANRLAAERSVGGGCPSDEELANGVRAELTAYSKPKPENFPGNETAFLCAVGLNCSCPSGRSGTKSCGSGSSTWAPCNSFDAATTEYCNRTANGSQPIEGTIAADPCFAFGTKLCINNKTYTVTDRGGWITGTHFDLWFDDYPEALRFRDTNARVTAGPCTIELEDVPLPPSGSPGRMY